MFELEFAAEILSLPSGAMKNVFKCVWSIISQHSPGRMWAGRQLLTFHRPFAKLHSLLEVLEKCTRFLIFRPFRLLAADSPGGGNFSRSVLADFTPRLSDLHFPFFHAFSPAFLPFGGVTHFDFLPGATTAANDRGDAMQRCLRATCKVQ